MKDFYGKMKDERWKMKDERGKMKDKLEMIDFYNAETRWNM
jgi:hypothetical protein